MKKYQENLLSRISTFSFNAYNLCDISVPFQEKKKRKPLRLQRPNFSSVVRRAFLSYVRFSDPCVKNIFRRERLFIGGLLFKNLLVYILLKTLPSFQENYPVLLIWRELFYQASGSSVDRTWFRQMRMGKEEGHASERKNGKNRGNIIFIWKGKKTGHSAWRKTGKNKGYVVFGQKGKKMGYTSGREMGKKKGYEVFVTMGKEVGHTSEQETG